MFIENFKKDFPELFEKMGNGSFSGWHTPIIEYCDEQTLKFQMFFDTGEPTRIKYDFFLFFKHDTQDWILKVGSPTIEPIIIEFKTKQHFADWLEIYAKSTQEYYDERSIY